MKAIIVFERGSKVHFVAKRLRSKGLEAEVVARPMKLSEDGCGYAIKFILEDIESVIDVLTAYNVKYASIYKVVKPGVFVAI